MARQRWVWEIPINPDTSRVDLELCAKADDRTSDTDTWSVAAQARAELWRRDQEEWAARSNAQESARVKAQKVQAAQITRQIEAQKKLLGLPLDVAEERSAQATVGLVI